MTKWFDTNYHYVVPEITAPVTAFRRCPGVSRWDADASGSVIGPVHPGAPEPPGRWAGPGDRGGPGGRCALGLGRGSSSAADPTFRLQLDEPSLGMALSETDEAMRHAAYAPAPEFTQVPIVTVQFGEASDETAMALARHGLAVQLPLPRGTLGRRRPPAGARGVRHGWPQRLAR